MVDGPQKAPAIGRALMGSATSQAGRQLIQFATTVGLAALLTPAEFGVISMATVVVGIVTIFRDLGTGAAVIQRPAVSPAMLSTLYWSNIAFGIGAAIVLLLTAPVFAAIFREPTLEGIVRALSITLIISSLGIVPQVLLERALAFGRIARIEILAAALGGIAAIGAAAAGFGPYSIVAQTVVTAAIVTLMAQRAAAFRPMLTWHRRELSQVAGYSAALTGFNLFNYASRNADNILIGRVLGAEALGIYALAYRLMLYPVQAVTWTINRVMFPTYSLLRHDPIALRTAYLDTTTLIGYIAFPMVLGIGAVAGRLIAELFPPDWAMAAVILRILTPVAAVQVILATTGPIYQATGRTGLLMGWGLVTGVATVAAFVVGLSGGIIGVALAYLVVTAILAVPTLLLAFRLIGLSLSSCLVALARPALAALVMVAVVVAADRALGGDGGLVQLLALIGLGALVYASTALIIGRRDIERLLQTVRPSHA
jgi:O-antigen/teichoic acid export membrane protein